MEGYVFISIWGNNLAGGAVMMHLQIAGIVSGGVAAPAYDPGMMTFNGTDAYYSVDGATLAGNALTTVIRFSIDSFTGGVEQRPFDVRGPGVRILLRVYPSDFATAELRNKLSILCSNSGGGNICDLLTDVDIVGSDKTIFFSYDATAGTAILYVNGLDADDTGYSARLLTTGTLHNSTASGTHSYAYGADSGGIKWIDGKSGYFGYSETYRTNPTDFYHPTNGLQELDESGWTEWGAQPLYWNQFGTMDDNKGSAGNMTENGTIPGPS